MDRCVSIFICIDTNIKIKSYSNFLQQIVKNYLFLQNIF